MLALTLLLSGCLIFSIFESYSGADRSVKALAVVRQALIAAHRVSIERGPANDVLDQETGPDTPSRKVLSEIRAATDSALKSTLSTAAAMADELGKTITPKGIERIEFQIRDTSCQTLAGLLEQIHGG